MSRKTVLYSRPGCHLCDEAGRILTAHGLEYQRIDIDQDPELRSRFDCCVPVVEIDGKVRFRGRVDSRLLQRIVTR